VSFFVCSGDRWVNVVLERGDSVGTLKEVSDNHPLDKNVNGIMWQSLE
jgi:hypothetical protein